MKHYLARFFIVPLFTLLVFGVFIQEILVNLVTPNFAYIDEVLLVLSILVLLVPFQQDTGFTKMVMGSFVMVLIFVAMSFNSFAFRSELTIFMQVLMHFKSFFFFLAFFNLRHYFNTRVIVHILLFLTVLGVLMNVVLGDQYNHLIDAKVTYRFDMVRPVGIQGSTMNLGITFAFMYLFYMFYKPRENFASAMPMTIGFAFICIFSSLRTPFVALLVSLLFIFGRSLKRWIIGTVLVLGIMPFFMNEYMDELIFMTLENFTTDPTESEYIRGIMIYFSVILAIDYFPFGTGAASYGTFLSDNSPVYRELGVSTLWYFQQKWGIYDSNLASLLGEFGVIGIGLFVFFLYKLMRLMVEAGANRVFAMAFFVMLLAYSAVAPIFMTSYPAVLMALLMTAAIPLGSSQQASEVQENKVPEDAEPEPHENEKDANVEPLPTKETVTELQGK